ncbi:hypothetical protein AB0B92_20355, partial [Streptomyces hygroscopicus]|uniref:hypothetical protein n=1 Tax=Streptomyces hygroscopicus TaxID=1912 RepID=UPI0033ECD184
MRNAHRQTTPDAPAVVPSDRTAQHCRAETTTGAEPNGTTHPRTAPRIAAPHRAPPHRTAHHIAFPTLLLAMLVVAARS